MKKNAGFRWAVLLFTVSLLTACASQKKEVEEQTSDTIDQTPVTLTIFNTNYADVEVFKQQFVAPVTKKYPYITLEVVSNTPDSRIETLIATKNTPDLVVGGGSGFAQQLLDLQYPAKLDALIKKHNVQMSDFSPNVLSAYRGYLGSNDTLMMPAGQMDFVMLYYNKELFNRFGVPYPKDGMTWEETYELAKRMTRLDGNAQIRGLDIQDNVLINYNQLSLSFVDPKTNRASVQNDGWGRWFRTMKMMYEIPGNFNPNTLSNINSKIDEFAKTQTLSMLVVGPIVSRLGPIEREAGLQWDIVSMPSFSGGEQAATQLNAPFVMMSQNTKHPDQAFLAIKAILSDENLSARAGNGQFTVSTKPEINQQFSTSSLDLKGKNAKALETYKAAKPQEYFSKYDGIVQNVLVNKFRDMLKTGKDVNTTLREAEEQANQQIAAAQTK